MAKIKYILRAELIELLQDPKFIAYAPNGGRTVGGELNGQFYYVRKIHGR